MYKIVIFVIFFLKFLYEISSVYAATIVTSFTYDSSGRVIKSELTGNSFLLSHFYSYDSVGNIINIATHSNSISPVDSDGDGIDDDWEFYYFNSLNTANSLTDSDGDHYLDIVEFKNWQNGVFDPVGIGFDPLVKNAPNGSGYQVNSSNLWLLIMPVLMNKNKLTP